jgi:hypothetical protein
MDEALADIIKNVPECLATGWVDMNTATLLEVTPVASQPQEVLDLIASATTEILQGANVVAIEELFKQTRAGRNGAQTGGHYFREIIVLTQNFIHVFARGRGGEGQVLVIVTRVSANLPLVITQTRAALSTVEAMD